MRLEIRRQVNISHMWETLELNDNPLLLVIEEGYMLVDVQSIEAADPAKTSFHVHGICRAIESLTMVGGKKVKAHITKRPERSGVLDTYYGHVEVEG